ALGERREVPHVGEQDADVHLYSPKRRLLKALTAQPRVLPRRGEAEPTHDLPADALVRRPAHGTPGVVGEAAHQPHEGARPMGLERLEERPVTLIAHETSITLGSHQVEYRRRSRVAVLREERVL